jgi:hypothetical protein
MVCEVHYTIFGKNESLEFRIIVNELNRKTLNASLKNKNRVYIPFTYSDCLTIIAEFHYNSLTCRLAKLRFVSSLFCGHKITILLNNTNVDIEVQRTNVTFVSFSGHSCEEGCELLSTNHKW